MVHCPSPIQERSQWEATLMVRCAARLEEAAAAARHTEADLQSRADDLHVQCTRLRAEAFTATSEWQGKVAELQHALDRGKMQGGGCMRMSMG